MSTVMIIFVFSLSMVIFYSFCMFLIETKKLKDVKYAYSLLNAYFTFIRRDIAYDKKHTHIISSSEKHMIFLIEHFIIWVNENTEIDSTKACIKSIKLLTNFRFIKKINDKEYLVLFTP